MKTLTLTTATMRGAQLLSGRQKHGIPDLPKTPGCAKLFSSSDGTGMAAHSFTGRLATAGSMQPWKLALRHGLHLTAGRHLRSPS